MCFTCTSPPAPPAQSYKTKPEQRFYLCSPWQNQNKLCLAPVVPASWLIAFVSYISKQAGTLITFCNTKLLWFTLSLPLSTLIVFLLATYNSKHLLIITFLQPNVFSLHTRICPILVASKLRIKIRYSQKNKANRKQNPCKTMTMLIETNVPLNPFTVKTSYCLACTYIMQKFSYQ